MDRVIQMDLIHTLSITDWQHKILANQQASALDLIEQGHLIYLPKLSFKLNPEEMRFLSPIYADQKNKNISFDHHADKIKGVTASLEDQMQLKKMLKRFAAHAMSLVSGLFPGYMSAIQQGRTSFRPVEINQRKSPSYRKDDTRLHVDAFPANPNQGRRILRVFSNINPHGQDRVWRIGEPFEEVARRFLPHIRMPIPGSSHLLRAFKITKNKRTTYDHIMLHLHDRMKADLNYQKEVRQMEVRFPAGTSWIVLTDQTSHAAMAGQFALEQTFYLPVSAMQAEANSPLRVLERLLNGRKLA